MTTISVKLPDDLHSELMDVARLGYEDKSEVIRESLRRALPSLKKSFIGRKQNTAKKIS